MALDDTGAGDPLRFILIDKNPSSADLKLLCQAPSEEVRQVWLERIRSLLDLQGDFLRGTFVSYILFLYLNNKIVSNW